jgi:hypothetical protein
MTRGFLGKRIAVYASSVSQSFFRRRKYWQSLSPTAPPNSWHSWHEIGTAFIADFLDASFTQMRLYKLIIRAQSIIDMLIIMFGCLVVV